VNIEFKPSARGFVRENLTVDAAGLEPLYQRVKDGPIRTRWHWLGYNFTAGTEGYTYFAPLTLMALDSVDQVMPGYADEMLTRLEQMPPGTTVGQHDHDRGEHRPIVYRRGPPPCRCSTNGATNSHSPSGTSLTDRGSSMHQTMHHQSHQPHETHS
jgi:hypothetical protein